MSELSAAAQRLLARAKAGQSQAPESMRERVRAAIDLQLSAAGTADSAGDTAHGHAAELTRSASAGWLASAAITGALVGGLVGMLSFTTPRERTTGADLDLPPSAAAELADSDLPPTAAAPAAPAQTAAVAGSDEAQPAAQVAESAEAEHGSPSLRAEMALLARAEKALRAGDARQALRVLASHRKRFAHGQLNEERQGLQLIAQCTLGRGVKQPLAQYLAASPEGVLEARVREACHAPAVKAP